MIVEKAYAKVNLFLNVLGKRKDGYHDLEMLNVKIDLHDLLEFNLIDCDNTVIIKSNDLFLSNQDNIVLQVAKHMLKNFNINNGLEIKIEKNIPFGAGLAGNSADSAAVIKGIDKLFNLNLSTKEMMDIGVIFSADIPYCLFDKPAFVSKIGEIVNDFELDLSEYKLLLINPREFISTKDVFGFADKHHFDIKDIDKIKEFCEQNNIPAIRENVHNSLEEIVINNYDFMRNFKDNLVAELGSEGLVMTGSGSSFIKILHKNEDVSDFISRYNEKYLIKLHNFL
ncbi:MAG: 4-(cytidine 5'-diphospho)-2-C-methyl-D-erythritol kinase [Tenericutes bacterium HGW-Tenericutes-5]|nr:MAG: 4-(cytidine 5'-diphospho)-2-C-methyl-D-erythritol kinase [Tenericutes bacterium HGW-Tenericutes-5]